MPLRMVLKQWNRFSFKRPWVAAYYRLLVTFRLTLGFAGLYNPTCWGLLNLAEIERGYWKVASLSLKAMAASAMLWMLFIR